MRYFSNFCWCWYERWIRAPTTIHFCVPGYETENKEPINTQTFFKFTGIVN